MSDNKTPSSAAHGRNKEFVMRFKHWALGCANFNRKYPHWVKSIKGVNDHQDDFPRCSICGSTAWHMFGYKKHKPDYLAQEIQGSTPSESTKYWAVHDGHG